MPYYHLKNNLSHLYIDVKLSLNNLGNAFDDARDVLKNIEKLKVLKSSNADTTDIEDLIHVFKNSNKAADAANVFKRLKIEGKDLEQVLKDIGYEAADIAPAMAGAEKFSTKLFTKMKGGFKGVADWLGTSTKALAGWSIGITAAITAITIGFKLYEEHVRESIDQANAAAESYSSQVSSLDQYKQEVTSLKESLDSNTLSEEEAYAARARLLEIQDELIDGYAFERGELDLLRMSVESVAAAFDNLNAKTARKNLAENASIIETAIDKMESVKTLYTDYINLDAIDEKAQKAIKDVIGKYDALQLRSTPDGYGGTRWFIEATGDAETLHNSLVDLSSDLQDLDKQFEADGIDIDDVFDFGKSWAKVIEEELEGVNETIDTYKATYDNAIVWKIAAEGYVDAKGEKKSYNNLMNELMDAQTAYTDAISSSYDTEEDRVAAVKKALTNLLAVKSKFDGINFSEDDIGVRDYFQNLFDQIQDSLEQEQLRIDLQATVNGQSPSDAASDLWNKFTSFTGNDGRINALDIRNAAQSMNARESSGAHYLGSELTEQERAYLQLQAACALYNVTVEEAIALGVQLGVIYDSTAAMTDDAASATLSRSEALRKSVSDLWGSIEFAESKASLIELADELGEITPASIKDLAAECKDLANILDEDGMSAEFLANILQKELDGADGFSLITEEMLGLNKALQGAAGMFDEVTKARKRYTDAMNVEEKDEGFKTYAEALKTINEEIAAGTTNSNAFWASAEFLFGEDQLAEWGWGDGIAEIKAGAQDLAGIFGDAESAGTGLLNKMYQMSQAGQLVNENGEKLVDISRNWDGSYDFAIDPSNIAELADQMGIAEEAVLACLEAMSMYGNVHFYNIEEVVSAVDDLGITMDIAGQKVVNLQQLEAHLKATGKSAWYIHEVKKAMEGLDGTTLLDITADTGALLTNIQNLGFATQDGLTFTVNYDNLVAFLSQMKFTEDQVKILTQSLIEADGVTLQSAIGQINDMNEAAVVLSTVEFGTAQDSLDGIVESIDDVDDSSIDNAQSQFEKFRKTCVQINKELLGIASNIGKVNSRSVTTGSTESGSGSGLHQQKPGFAPSAHYASGTLYAKKGAALLGDEYSPNGEPKPELVVSDGGAYLAGVDGPTIGYLQDGDRVYTADETEKILGGKSRIIGSIPAFAVGKNINATNVQDGAAGPRHPDIVINGLGGNTTVVVEPPAKTPATTEEEEQDISPISPDSTPGLTPPNGKFFGNNIPKPESNSGDTGGNNSSVKSDEESEFERLYKEHQHNLAMDRETEEEYLEWLEKAYKEAYEKNEITLDEYRQYEEEVYELQKQIFDDHLKDIEHKIDVLSREPGNEREIISLYQEMIVSIEKEIAAAKARGLDENSDYIQDLESQLYDYKDEIAEIEEEITENAKDAVDELVEYRIDMIKQDLENEKDALNDRLDQLRDFYDEQKQMLQDQYDEEKYLEEQSEKRKTKNEIEAELAQLQFDDSAWAQKRKLELQEELANADKDLKDFERDHALEQAQDLLDKTLEKQEEALQAQIDAIDAKLNDPDALYNQALNDIKNNTGDLYQEMVDYNNAYGSGNPEEIQEMWDNAYKSLEEYMILFGEAYKDVALVASTGTINTSSTGFASGTKSATPGLHGVDELGPEHVFVSANGKRYRLFNGDEKVLDAKATNFLYNFATSGGSFITEAFGKLIQKVQAFSMEKVSKPTQLIELKAGDIVIQGNATERTVSEIRRAQRDNLDFVMKEFIRLNR